MATLIENAECYLLKLWKKEELYMVSPVPQHWPKNRISASNLKFEDYFTESQLPEIDMKNFDTFIDSIPIPHFEEHKIYITALRAYADVLNSKSLLLEEGKYQILYLLIVVTMSKSIY